MKGRHQRRPCFISDIGEPSVDKNRLVDKATVTTAFRERYGREPNVVVRAPGRVNLIGEHTDYQAGFVFPAAIDRQLWIAAALSGSDECRLVSRAFPEPSSFKVSSLKDDWSKRWEKYIAGMAWAIQNHTGRALPGIDAFIDGTLPTSSGLSSSAAIEMAAGVMWNALARLDLATETLAELGKVCENQFVNVKSGIMDQMASVHGKAGHALFIDTRNRTFEAVAVPDSLSIVVMDTGTPRNLGIEYNKRPEHAQLAVEALKKTYPNIETLRDVDIGMLEGVQDTLDPLLFSRAKHIVTENARVLGFKRALTTDNKIAIGALMIASHESLRYDYEVSTDALNAMVEAANHAPGFVGARLTGAGFGGACVALVETERAAAFMKAVDKTYRAKEAQANPTFFLCQAADGAAVAQ